MLSKDYRISRKRQENFQFPRADIIPAGIYHSTIVGVDDSFTNSGAPAIDIRYDLVKDQKHYYIHLRYPLDSQFFDQLCDRLLDSGLEDGSSFTDAIGLEETVEVYYPGEYGSIRAPETPCAPETPRVPHPYRPISKKVKTLGDILN